MPEPKLAPSRSVQIRRVRLANFRITKVFEFLLFWDFQIAAQEEFRAIDDGVCTKNFASLWWQLSKGVDGGPKAVFEGSKAFHYLRLGGLSANDGVEVDLSRSGFDLLRDRSLVNIVA